MDFVLNSSQNEFLNSTFSPSFGHRLGTAKLFYEIKDTKETGIMLVKKDYYRRPSQYAIPAIPAIVPAILAIIGPVFFDLF